MFLFYHHEQNEKNYKYYKGILFEKLLSEYLSKNGYEVTIRQKHNSLEYDLEGVDKTTNNKIVGEAKAHENSIDGQTVSAFVGKLMPLGLYNKKVHGLFLSTSPLTSEATEYYNSIKDFGVTCYTGRVLFDVILDSLDLPTKKQICNIVEKFKYNPLTDYILTTNFGYSRLVTATISTSMIPSHFFVITHKGDLIDDMNLLKTYQTNIKELSSLEPVFEKIQPNVNTEYRTIRKGLLLGKGWTDFRLPAAPQFFVGRNELINDITNVVNNKTQTSHVIQIKSRSGVGKSSTLALIYNKFEKLGYNVELHDSRDIKSVLDIFTIIRRFTNCNSIPQDFTEVEKQFIICGSNKNLNIFMVDQFESTFVQPEIFTAYETIAKIIYQLDLDLYFFLARKNDQITTYDTTLISLQQLNSISKNFELRDFTKEEAKLLIDNINDFSSKTISKDVLSYVLEFAQGFPWLLKRTMAHILKLTVDVNLSQRELINTGLMLDDLFKEELEGLEEIEKEYLIKICSRLPADFLQLQRHFDDDPLVPKMLDKLTQVRLLRLSGDTYDTYNDVFKEYLIYQKLPEFKHQFIYRQRSNSVIKFFEKIVNKNRFTIEQLSKSLKTGQKTLVNYIKECRNLNLIKREDIYWIVPKNVRDIYRQGNFGEYIRRQLLGNDLVSNLLLDITKNDFYTSQLNDFLKHFFPYVEANDATWTSYRNVLLSWLEATKIIEITKTSKIVPMELSKEDIQYNLGNLTELSYSRRGKSGKALINNLNLLIPSVSWKHFEECFEILKKEDIPSKGECKKAYADMRKTNIISRINEIANIEELRHIVILEYLSSEQYKKVWEAAKTGKNICNTVKELLPMDISNTTIAWRSKKIINWGKSLGIIEKKRYRHTLSNP